MLGWIVSLFTTVLTFFNTIIALLKNAPAVMATMIDFFDFGIDTATVFMSNFPVPILTIAFIFLNIVILKIVIEVI